MSPNHSLATVSVVAPMFLLWNSESRREQMDLLNRNWDLSCRNLYKPILNVSLLLPVLEKVVLQ